MKDSPKTPREEISMLKNRKITRLFGVVVLIALLTMSMSVIGLAGHRRFEAPFNNTNSWTTDTPLVDDAYANANNGTGGFTCIANATAGAAKSIALQSVYIQLDRPQEVHVKAKIEFHGGSNVVGIGAFAGVEKLWGHGDNLNKTNIEGGLNYGALEDRIGRIADLKNLDVKSYVKSLVTDIAGVYELTKALDRIGEPKTAYVNFSFSGDQGYNHIHAGLRALATGAVSGQGASLVVGRVKYIEVSW